ncbi:uncharacterized protein LOC128757409 isoform X1 [Synchiropus splendidus]|uniref:uncharacterized protein LOC128757409 isoform X1 n=1 Tax=Synchiropus splendidus TaxID=270530 RepID=UPI00237E3B06|nr:uncharacterized protein LOC128757409 isoform X1 [Synchiropus splendidus]XP_053718649.1 uncharacterized protein LOC128757409 isoform X1 [Synchiropus splendidus]
MRTLVRLVLGLFTLQAVVASPRFSRQADSYHGSHYDGNELNLENPDLYDYEDGLTIEDPQIEIGTLAPPDYHYPIPEASLEEQEGLEEEEEEEMPMMPQLVPQGSGGSGVLMGPDTQKEVELRLTPIDILHVSGDLGSSDGSGASGVSGAPEASTSGVSGDQEAPSGSGSSGDIVLVSGDSVEILSAAGSGEFLLSGDLLVSGDLSGDLSGSGQASADLGSAASGVSIEFPEGSVDLSGFSGDLLASGASGISGVSGDSEESGVSGIILLPGEEELPLIPTTAPHEATGASGEFSGASGTSGDLGDLGISGVSGDSSVSGESGEPEVSGASGDIVITEVSGDVELTEPSGDTRISEASGEVEVSGDSGTSVVSGSGDTEEVPGVTLVPDIDKEEGLLPTTAETPQEGAGGVEEASGSEPEEAVVDRRGMPTCLLCTCLGGSVYCDDLKLDQVPPLPKDTTHFYARYNRITKINKSDFAAMSKLKRVDLTANQIASVDDKAFLGLPNLEELVLRENRLSQLPALPETMTLIDASHNSIASKGLGREAFKDMTGLLYLYLTDNQLDHVPVPLPDSLRSLHLQRNNIQSMHEDTFCNLRDFSYIRNALEDIRLDGNPLNLSRTPQAYICLPRIPIGDLI